jgi:hypothetical protein
MSSKAAIRRKRKISLKKRPKQRTARRGKGKKRSHRVSAKKSVAHRQRRRRQQAVNLPPLAPTLF